MQGYLRDYLVTILTDWCENISEESVYVGILNQNVRLSNLVLKKRSWPISPQWKVCLEFGTIGLFSLQCQLSKLLLGHLDIELENVQIVVSIQANDTQSVLDNTNEQLENLGRREVESLQMKAAAGTRRVTPWILTYMKSFAQSLLAKFVANSTLAAHDINVSLLLPQGQDKSVHFKFPVQSIHIIPLTRRDSMEKNKNNHSPSGGKMDFFCGKDITLRQFGFQVQTSMTPITQEDFQSLILPTNTVSSSIVLAPTSMSVQLWGKKPHNLPNTLDSIKSIAIDASLQNIEFAITTGQLIAAGGWSTYLSAQALKEKIKYFFTTTRGPLKGKILFACLVRVIIVMIREKTKGATEATLFYDIHKRCILRRYRALYSRILASRLRMGKSEKSSVDQASSTPNSTLFEFLRTQLEGTDLSIEDKTTFEFLCRMMACDEQLRLRMLVHENILSNGKSISDLLAAVLNVKTKSWWNVFNGGGNELLKNELNEGSGRVNIDQIKEGDTFAFEVDFRISRISGSVKSAAHSSLSPNLHSESMTNFYHESSNFSPAKSNNMNESISLVLYGLHLGTLIGEDESITAQVSLGVFKLFGVGGDDLVLSGNDSLDWFNFERTTSNEFNGRGRALRATYQSFPFHYSTSDTTSTDCDAIFAHHTVAEVYLDLIQVRYSTRSVVFIARIIDHVKVRSPPSKHPLNSYRAMVSNSDLKRKRENTHRFSLEVQSKGFTVSIPFERSSEGSILSSPTVSRRALTPRPSKQAITAFFPSVYVSNHIPTLQLSVGSISVLSGDFLQNFVSSRESSNIEFNRTANLNSAKKSNNHPHYEERVFPAENEQDPKVGSVLDRLISKFSLDELPILFAVSEISVLFVERSDMSLSYGNDPEGKLLNSVISKPWTINGAFSQGAIKSEVELGNSLIIDTTALSLSVSTQCIKDLMDIASEISAALQLSSDHDSSTSSPPNSKNSEYGHMESLYSNVRLGKLAQMPSLSLDLFVEAIQVEVYEVDIQNDSREDILKGIIASYCKFIRARGEYSYASLVKKGLCLQQLINMGISKEACDKILSDPEITNRSRTNSTVDDAATRIIENYGSSTNSISGEDFKAIICRFVTTQISLNHYGLTYDSITVLNLRSLMLYDSNYLPILSFPLATSRTVDASNKKSSSDREKHKHRKKEAPQKFKTGCGLPNHFDARSSLRDRSNMERLRKIYDETKSCLKICIVMKDKDFSFGQGGYSIRDVRTGTINNFISQPYNEGEICTGVIDFAFSSSAVVKMVEKLSYLIEQVKVHDSVSSPGSFQEMSANHSLERQPSFLRIDSQNSMDFIKQSQRRKFSGSPKEAFIVSKPSLLFNLSVKIGCLNCTLGASDEIFILRALISDITLEVKDLFNTFRERNSTFKLQSLQLHDLTELGSLHHEIIWIKRTGKKGSFRAEHQLTAPLLIGTCRESIIRDGPLSSDLHFFDIKGSLCHLRVCFLYRFIIDIVNFINIHIAKPISNHFDQHSKNENSGEQFKKFDDDNVSEAAEDGMGHQSDSDEVSSTEYFESERNQAQFHLFSSRSYISLLSEFNESSPILDGSRSKSSSNVPVTSPTQHTEKQSHIPSPPVVEAAAISFSILFEVVDLTAFGPRNSISKDMTGVNVETLILRISNEDFPWYVPEVNTESHADSENNHLYFDLNSNSWNHFSDSHDQKDDIQYDSCSNSATEAKKDKTLRISLIAHSARAFTSLSQPFRRSSLGGQASSKPDNFFVVGEEHLFQEICDGDLVYDIKMMSSNGLKSNSSNNTQLWQQISGTPFNFRMVLDFTSTQVRLLFCDDAVSSVVNFHVSQSELYLIIAIWSENVCECSQFLESKTNDSEQPKPKVDLPHSLSELENSFDSYGSKKYCDFLANREGWFELLIVLENVAVMCAIDSNYFSRSIPSDGCLSATTDILRSDWPLQGTAHAPPTSTSDKRRASVIAGKPWKSRVKPIAKVEASGMFLHLKMDYDCIHMSLSMGNVIVTDIRSPAKSVHPIVFSVHDSNFPSKGVKYGYSDFLYGFNLLPSSVLASEKNLPFKMSFCSSSISNWMTLNIGLDSSNLNILNMDLVWLIAEYVSCYFRFAEYGHPAIDAYEKLNKEIIPYGGIDTRLFVTRPHITMIRHPLAFSSQVLQLESEKGLFFRYVLDNTSAVRMELNVYDLAVVLVRRYKPPQIARGLRGASGSGRGIRTLIEYFSFSMFYFFSAVDNHLDVKFDCFGQSADAPQYRNSDNNWTDGFCVNLNAEELKLKPMKIPSPTCLISPVTLPPKFGSDSCDVVTCYEDILFCYELVSTFFGFKNDMSQNKKEARHAIRSDTRRIDDEKEVECDSKKCSLFVVLSLTAMRIMIVDNVLGLHLPLIQIFVDSIMSTLRRDKGIECYDKSPVEPEIKSLRNLGFFNSKSQSIYGDNFENGISEAILSQRNEQLSDLESTAFQSSVKHQLFLLADCVLSMEYFNNIKKCWEPLMDKLYITVFHEKSPSRGDGFSLKVRNAMHLNISGALIRTLNDLLRTTQFSEEEPKNDKGGEDYEADENFAFDRHHLTNSHRQTKIFNRKPSILLDSPSSELEVRNSRSPSDSQANYLHLQSGALSSALRVGFSIYNLTGQAVRYLQQWEGGRRTIQYINDRERGLLNFIASYTSIRNGSAVEVPFDVQLDKGERKHTRSNRKNAGNRVALQLAGFEWLRAVQADELGIQFHAVNPVMGRRKVVESDVENALKLVTEVLPHCGGRMLRLRSVFTIKNNTRHAINILAQDDSKLSESKDNAFRIEQNETFYVPLSLLYRSVHDKRSLSRLRICPAEIQPILEDLNALSGIQATSVNPSTDPIDLFKTMAQEGSDDHDAFLLSSSVSQLRCTINTQFEDSYRNFNVKSFNNEVDTYISTSIVPPVCYNIEVIEEFLNTSAYDNSEPNVDMPQLSRFWFPDTERSRQKLSRSAPRCYVIEIHPPIVLENLLPTVAYFEIIHAVHKRVLWKSWVLSEATTSIHTVTLDQPLILLISANYCHTADGLLFHDPILSNAQRRSKQNAKWNGDVESEISDVVLCDTCGQRLRLNVENIEGGGGQRHLIVYCPFWIVNTSQYSFRIREEGSTNLPAGTVTAQKDGSRMLPINKAHEERRPTSNLIATQNNENRGNIVNQKIGVYDFAASMSSSNDRSELSVPSIQPFSHSSENLRAFPGKIGSLHNSKAETDVNWRTHHFLQELTFEEIKNISYLFNYTEDSSYILGGRRVKIQLDDSTWSNPFSLDSVGVNQIVSTNHASKGCLEVGFKISVAPGRLSKYTKIIRFLPHYTIVNKLPVTLTVFQPSGFAGQILELDVSPESIRPYHLPSKNGQRKIGLKIEGPWSKTVVFPIDQIGTYTMAISKKIDMTSITHVNARGDPEYTIEVLRESTKGVFGVWFETDWGGGMVVVRKILPGSFAAGTKIHAGDVLLGIDGIMTEGKTFDLVMEMLKAATAKESCSLTFRTLEERLNIIRRSANYRIGHPRGPSRDTNHLESQITSAMKAKDISDDDNMVLKVEFRQFESSIAISVNEIVDATNMEYRIDNKSLCYVIHYKQRGIVGNKWLTLQPGQTAPFAWEDPFGPHKLSLIVGRSILTPYCVPDKNPSQIPIQNSYLGNSSILSFDQNLVIIDFDVIGSALSVPLPFRDQRQQKSLLASVKSVGRFKILEIAPNREKKHMLLELDYSLKFFDEQIRCIAKFQDCLVDITKSIKDILEPNEHIDRTSSLETISEQKIEKMETLEQRRRLWDRSSLFETNYQAFMLEIKAKQQELLKFLEREYLGKIVRDHLNKPEKLFASQMDAKLLKLKEETFARLDVTSIEDLSTSELKELKELETSIIPVDVLRENDSEGFKKLELEAAKAVDPAHLVSYAPIESMFESTITAQNQLLIDVLEARDISPTVLGKIEDVYCRVYVETRESKMKWRKHFCTYVCEQTMDPSWLYQRFIFQLPTSDEGSKSLQSPGDIKHCGGFTLRVDVLAKSSVGLDQVLGRADIQLSYLENEKVLSGWFPLRHNSSSALLNDGSSEVFSGSIKLNIQWITTVSGLANYYFEATYKRLLELKLHRKVLNFYNEYYRKSDDIRRTEPSYFRDQKLFQQENFYAMMLNSQKVHLSAQEYLEHRIKKISKVEEPTDVVRVLNESRNSIRGVAFSNGPSRDEILRRADENYRGEKGLLRSALASASKDHGRSRSESMSSIFGTTTPRNMRSKSRAFSPLKLPILSYPIDESESPECIPAPVVTFSHDEAYRLWAEEYFTRYKHIHSKMAHFMTRNAETTDDEIVFKERFNEECEKTFVSLHSIEGDIEVIPLQAQNLPESQNAVFVRISYGEEKFETFSMPPASILSWYQEKMDDNFSQFTSVMGSGKGMDARKKFSGTGRDSKAQSSEGGVFAVNSLNIRGTIKVRVMSEGFPKARTLAELNIPVFNLLECTCKGDSKEYYERWFPLTPKEDVIIGEGELEKVFRSYYTEHINNASFGYNPCIHLKIQWKSRKADGDSVEQIFKMYNRIQVPAVTVAVIDSQHAVELLQVSMIGLEVRRTVTEVITDTNINLTRLQVDNELPDPIAPVILCPTFQRHPQPVLRLHFRERLPHNNIESFTEIIDLSIQELDVKLEQQTVLAAWDLIKSWLDERKFDQEGNIPNSEADLIKSVNDSEINASEDILKDNLFTDGMKLWSFCGNFFSRNSNGENDNEDNKVYVELFRIHPVKFNVSFITTPQVVSMKSLSRQQSTDMRNQRVTGLFSNLSLFFWQVGEVILSLTSTISDAPIFFHGFILENMFKSDSEVQRTLQEHYLHSAFRQLYKIVGSLELVGNPYGLLNSLSVGVVDFFYEPAHAIITSPTEFRKIGKGVFKGTVSLVGNISTGLLGSSIGVTQSVSRITSKVTMDKSYMLAREKLQRPPRTLTGIITRPIKDVGTGLYYASTGLVKLPYVGYVNKGVPGLVKGVGKGLAGTLTKPMVGIFDACAHSFGGAKDFIDVSTIKSADPVPRLRLSDLFGPDGRILPYNFSNSLGSYLLHLLDQSKEDEFVGTAIHDGLGALHICGKLFESEVHVPDQSAMKRRLSISGPYDRRNSIAARAAGKRHNSRMDLVTTQTAVEFVVSTSIIKRAEGGDEVVIITTLRIVVVLYKRHNHRTPFTLVWERKLDSLGIPKVEQIGGGFQLYFGETSLPFQRLKSMSRLSRFSSSLSSRSTSQDKYVIYCNDNEEDVLRNIANVLNTLLGRFDSVFDRQLLHTHLRTNISAVCDRVDEGRIDIGPWQFIEDSMYSTSPEELAMHNDWSHDKDLDLDLEPWRVSPQANAQNLPSWLIEERQQAVDSHTHLRKIDEIITLSGVPKYKIQQDFEDGVVTVEQFFARHANAESSAYQSSPSVVDDVSNCSGFESKDKRQVMWDFGQSVVSFAVNSGTSLNLNLSKIVSKKSILSSRSHNVPSESEASNGKISDLNMKYGEDVTEKVQQKGEDSSDDVSYSTCASTSGGVDSKKSKKKMPSSAPSKLIIKSVDESNGSHQQDDNLKAEVSENGNEINGGLPITDAASTLIPFQQEQASSATETNEIDLNYPQDTQPLSSIPSHQSNIDTHIQIPREQSQNHHRNSDHDNLSRGTVPNRRKATIFGENNPMMANRRPPQSESKVHTEAKGNDVNSPASIVEEVNYESIYSTLQMVNGVVSTPPARLVDAIAAPVDSTELTVLLLNERINRLESLILLTLNSNMNTMPTRAPSNMDSPDAFELPAMNAVRMSDENQQMIADQMVPFSEENESDYLIDSMPHQPSLDPMNSSRLSSSSKE